MTAPRRPPPARRPYRPGLVPLLGTILVLGCESGVTEPPPGPPPPEPLPSRIEVVYPPARSTGVLYDTGVWVRFTTPLDTTSLGTRTVALMADTRRLPIALAWEPATRTLRITPLELLALRQTYTVTLTEGLRFADGVTLAQPFESQFTTNSLRRVQSPLPMDRQGEQSPFVALRWGGLTDGPYGVVQYEIHVAPDPAAVTDPGHTPLVTTLTPLYWPRTRWRMDGPNYWAIHVRHTQTGERLVGPVWRFDTVAPDTPVDSVLAPFSDYTWVGPNRVNRCAGNELSMGPDIVCTYRWSLGPPDTTIRLAGAAIEMTPQASTPPPAANGPSVWYATTSWPPCDAGYPGPPFTDEPNGRLADAVAVSPTRIRFSSDALAAHIEATRRFGGFYGYLFRSGVTRRYWPAFTAQPNPVLWLYFYRRSPG